MIIVNLSREKYGYVTLTNVLEQWEKIVELTGKEVVGTEST